MERITFITNTGADTLEYTKLLLKSLNENLFGKEHEIIVFVDSDTDGTVDYLKSVKKDFFNLKIVTHKVKPLLGHQRNSNLLVELASNEIISYLQSDMVVSKNYDIQILKDLEEDCILSSTRIEPPLHGKSPVTFTENFGIVPNEFKWDSFLNFAESVKSDKVIDYFFAPYTFHKKTWLKTEGYDTRFRRAREDSDFVQRCLHLDIKLKQTFRANVYHFTCVSSRGKNWYDLNNQAAQKRVELQKSADQIEMRRFIRKWGAFNHGEFKLEKLNIDLIVYGNIIGNENFIANIEPFFTRIWLGTRDERDSMIRHHSIEHEYANKLLNFTDEEWNHASKYFNTTNYEKIYNLGKPENFSIKIILNLNKLQKDDEILSNIHNLTMIFSDYTIGKYEYGPWNIEIRSFDSISNQYFSNINPPFDNSLLQIE